MATAVPRSEFDKICENETDIFNCPICLERFKTPKCLPCQHSFCESCLQTYIESTKTADNESLESFQCPFCRQTVNSPKANSQPKEWASLMPTNQTLLSLIENCVADRSTSSRRCRPCERDNESSQGSFWCPKCLECYCETCAKFHKRMKSSKMHKLVPLDEMEGLTEQMAEIDEPCPEHANEVLKVYCVGHKKICCVICLVSNHRECKEIETLDEIVEKTKDGKHALEFIGHLQNIRARAIAVAQKKKDNMDYLNKKHKDISEEADTLIEKTKLNLDTIKEGFKIKLKTLHKENQMKLSETKEKIEIFQKSLEHSERFLTVVSKSGTSKQLFIAVGKVKSQIGADLQHLQFGSEDDKEIDYNLRVDSVLTAVTNVKSLADLSTKRSPCKQKILPVVESAKLVCEMELEQNQFLNADITDLGAVKLWDVKGNGYFTDAVFLSNGYLVCCDFRNNRLEAYDKHGTLKCTQNAKYCPGCIAANKENELFVVAYSQDILTTYSLYKDKFDELQTLSIPEATNGIAILGNIIILPCNKNINIMTTFGTRLTSIPNDVGKYPTPFQFIATVKPNFCYCIDNVNTVTTKSLDGTEVKKYMLPEFVDSPRGIALDQNKNTFVCGFGSNNIVMISSDYKKNCIFLKTSFKPYSIGFDHTGTRFFVTAYKFEETSIQHPSVEVYKMCLKKKNVTKKH